MRYILVECDGANCLNKIELADDEEFQISEALFEFDWYVIDGEDYCENCGAKIEAQGYA